MRKITAKDVYASLLKGRFHERNGFVCVPEFIPGAGNYGGVTSSQRRIDLFAIECAPSKGMPTHSVEIKVSRGDWLRELKNLEKMRSAIAISNYFWVAAPRDIVKLEELPVGVGLFEVVEVDDGVYASISVHAAYRDKTRCSWAMFASMARNLHKRLEKQEGRDG